MALSAVNWLTNFIYVIKCLLKNHDRICTAYIQQSARCLINHFVQANMFV